MNVGKHKITSFWSDRGLDFIDTISKRNNGMYFYRAKDGVKDTNPIFTLSKDYRPFKAI